MNTIRTPALCAALAACFTVNIPAARAQAQPVSAPLDSIAERTRACTACHGKEGRATADGYFPRIAGKPEGYLFNQLVNFRDGRRQNAAMIYMVQHMTDGYLREIAAYFSSLDLPYPAPQKAGTVAQALQRGEAIVRQGIPARDVPACTKCHGDSLTGVAPAMPGLLGLPRDYVIGEFGAWRSGQRKTPAPDCMAQITSRMKPEEISAAAMWLAAQPLPPVSRPAASIALPLPLQCGSGAAP